MKISRKKLRKLINESVSEFVDPNVFKGINEGMKGFKDPTDDPRFSDPSYIGRPGSYTQSYDFDEKKQTGISIEVAFYDNNHPLYRGDIDFYEYGAESAEDLSEQQYRKIESDVMAIISHPASKLEENEKYEASQEFIDAMRGDENSTGTYFYPIFDESDDYDGPDDFDDDPYSYMGNFGPDMFSR